MIETMQMYKMARLLLNVGEGMTDENDVDHLEWILEQLGVDRVDLSTALNGNWDSDNIDELIWLGA